jgi:hypothetical protein
MSQRWFDLAQGERLPAELQNDMARDSNPSRSSPGLSTTNSAKVVQHLLAHARLCREIAACSSDESSAQRLEELAAACVRTACAADVPPIGGQLH